MIYDLRGAGYMVVPDAGVNFVAPFDNVSPEMQYGITFNKTGTHYVFLLSKGPSSASNSCHIGIDDDPVVSGSDIGYIPSSLGWSSLTMGHGKARFNVDAAGVHTLNLWMREDGTQIDKILIEKLYR